MTNRKEIIEGIIDCIHSTKRVFGGNHFKAFGNITAAQLPIIGMLGHFEELNVKDIAGKMGITSSAVTQLVDGLEKHGYVERKIKADNRREMLITLTKKTKENLAKIKKSHLQNFNMFFKNLSDNDLKDFLRIIRIINNHDSK